MKKKNVGVCNYAFFCIITKTNAVQIYLNFIENLQLEIWINKKIEISKVTFALTGRECNIINREGENNSKHHEKCVLQKKNRWI